MKFLMFFLAVLTSFSLSATEIKLTTDNTVSLRTSFSSSSIAKLESEMLEMDSKLKSGYPIYLVLNTPGGSIQAGLELFEFVKGLNRPVHTVTIFAASMGFQTVQNLGKRFILKYGTLMSHKARGGFEGEFGGGLSQLDSRYNFWLKRINLLDKTTVERTEGKQTLLTYRASYDNELWLTGSEAVKLGYADEVVTVSCSPELNALSDKEVMDLGFFQVETEFSKCPLYTAPVKVKGNILTNKGYMELKEFLTKNGEFKKGCDSKEVEVQDFYNGNSTKTVKTDKLCVYDDSITFDKITKEIKNRERYFNQIRNHIEYSY